MTKIDLADIGLTVPRRWEAIIWLEKTHGNMGTGKWKISNLRYLTFKKDQDATIFILKWAR